MVYLKATNTETKLKVPAKNHLLNLKCIGQSDQLNFRAKYLRTRMSCIRKLIDHRLRSYTTQRSKVSLHYTPPNF